MLVYGDHDNFLPLETVARFKEIFPDVRYQLIPDTGHNSFVEHPDAVVAALDAFINSRS